MSTSSEQSNRSGPTPAKQYFTSYLWHYALIRSGHIKGALAWYGKLTWESAHAWILKILCFLIVWGITLIFMVCLSFYAISLLIYDVMNDITIIR